MSRFFSSAASRAVARIQWLLNGTTKVQNVQAYLAAVESGVGALPELAAKVDKGLVK